MKVWNRTITILLFTVSSLVAGTAFAGDVDKAAAKAEVDAAVTGMYQAYAENDAKGYFSFFADDAVMLTSAGKEQPASEYEESWSGIIAAGGGVVSYDPKFPRSIRISDDGMTAVVLVAGVPATYKFPDGSEPGKFNDASYKWAETLVWTKNNGNWKLVHFHYADVSS